MKEITLESSVRDLCLVCVMRSSSGYTDELAWGAAWLYRATGEQGYLNQALEFANPNDVAWAFNWDGKLAGAQVSLLVHY